MVLEYSPTKTKENQPQLGSSITEAVVLADTDDSSKLEDDFAGYNCIVTSSKNNI